MSRSNIRSAHPFAFSFAVFAAGVMSFGLVVAIAVQRDGRHLSAQAQQQKYDTLYFFGNPTDTPLTGRWGGENDRIGVHRGNVFFQDANDTGKWEGVDGGDRRFSFGTDGDYPIRGDWNGDGLDDVGIWRNRTFYLDLDGNGAYGPGDGKYGFGVVTDTPVIGDWDGDGDDDIGVARDLRKTKLWLLDINDSGTWDPAGGDRVFSFGIGGDVPVVGDWNDDGVDDVGVARNMANGIMTFFLDSDGNGKWSPQGGNGNSSSSNGNSSSSKVSSMSSPSKWGDRTGNFGMVGDRPIAGNWDGVGGDEIGVHRAGKFFLDLNGNLAWDALPPPADLGITKSGPDTISPTADTLRYTIMLTNHGPGVATDVYVEDVIDELEFDVHHSDPRCFKEGGEEFCGPFSILPGHSLEFMIAFTFEGIAECDSAIENLVRIKSSSAPDPVRENNESEPVRTIVECLKPSTASLEVAIDGPESQLYAPGEDDTILGNMVFTSRPEEGEDIDLHEFTVLIEAPIEDRRDSNGETVRGDATPIIALLEDVKIHDAVSGLSIPGEVLEQFPSPSPHSRTQLYRFNGLPMNSDAVWQFRADVVDHGSGNQGISGTKFRIHICGEPQFDLMDGLIVQNEVTCNFGGLMQETTDFHMAVSEWPSGDPIWDVRPRGTISGNFHSVTDPMLRVSVLQTVSYASAVENQKDITLLRFQAGANEVSDLLFTKFAFESEVGSLLNAENYTLWVDTDDNGEMDTILAEDVAPFDERVTFRDFVRDSIVVAGKNAIYEVHADVSRDLSGDELQLRFAKGPVEYAADPSEYFIGAEDLESSAPLRGIQLLPDLCSTYCHILFSHASSTLWSLRNQGSLFVTQDSTPLRSRQLLGGEIGESVLRLQFFAEKESIEVTDLQFTSMGSEATSVNSLELFLDGAAEPFAIATIGGCGTDIVPTEHEGVPVRTFCADMEYRELPLPEGRNLDVALKPRMENDNEGGISGEKIRFFLSGKAVSDTATGEGAVRALGEESQSNLVANDGDDLAEGEIFIGTVSPGSNTDIVGNANISVHAKIDSIVNANSDADGSAVPTGFADIGAFKISALPHVNYNNGTNDVVISGLVFDVDARHVNIAPGSFTLHNKSDTTFSSSCIAYDTAVNGEPLPLDHSHTGNMLVLCSDLDSFVNTAIDDGTSITFVLQANIENANTSSTEESVLRVSITDFSVPRAEFGVLPGQSHISWRDVDSVTLQEFVWVDLPETAVHSTVYGIQPRTLGNLFITQERLPQSERPLLGGTLGESILRINLTAVGDEVSVERLVFKLSGKSVSVDGLSLYKDGDQEAFARATQGACGEMTSPPWILETFFCVLLTERELVIPNGSQIAVTARPRIKTDEEGGMSGEENGSYFAAAAAAGSDGIPLVTNDGDTLAEGEVFVGTGAPGPDAIIYERGGRVSMSLISSVRNANTDADGTVVPTGVADIGQFRFTAFVNANTKYGLNRVVPDHMEFTVFADNVEIAAGSFTFFNKSDSTMTAPCVATDIAGKLLPVDRPHTGEMLVQCRNLIQSGVVTDIGSGEDQIFVLEASIRNGMISSSLQSQLQVALRNL